MKHFSITLRTLPPWKQHLHSVMLSLFFMSIALVACFLYHQIVPDHSANIALIFILALICISRYTVGYMYGLLSSFAAVILINWIFTYPYFKVNFTTGTYPITFIIMLGISLFTSTMTSHLTKQAEVIAHRERQLIEAENEKMRANLLRAISHDLRTPLTGIIGSSSLLLDKPDILSREEKRAILTNIYEDSDWLLHMVENLLTVTRMQGDNFNITTCDEAVEEVISESLLKFHKRYPDQQVIVHFPEEFIMLPMDAILIEQVTVNLLENAVNHSHTDKPIDFLVEDHPDNVTFTIRDHGVGIPRNMLEHLFDGTAYLATQIADTRKGMGIGLSICKTIITAHNGTLIGQNHADGAEFIFTLPKIHQASQRRNHYDHQS